MTQPTGRRPVRPKTRNVARRDVDLARLTAWRTLRAVQAEDAYANLVLPRLLREVRLKGRDAAFATELAYGALRGIGTYDAVLGACTDRPIADVDPALLDALRLGTHQLLALRVPAHAAVTSTVDLVRSEVGQGAAGYANAVLRAVTAKDLAGWLEQVAPDAATDPDGHLAVVHSHPVWIVRALRDALRLAGRDAAELPALLAADNDRPAVALVALPGLAVAEDLRVGGAAPRPGLLSPLAALVAGTPDDVPAVRHGRARVQDEGSQLVALALANAPLEGPDTGRWLDLCAGPGGKAALLAATLLQRRSAGEVPATAVLVANEITPHRVELVERSVAAVAEHATRGEGRPVIEVRSADGRRLAEDDPGTSGAFDRVLVDAPCTGLGALRRRPEARWRRTPSDLAALGPLQRDLLRAALDAVRPGGLVAYVTCSPHPAETRLVVDDVLRGRDDVVRVDAREVVLAVAPRLGEADQVRGDGDQGDQGDGDQGDGDQGDGDQGDGDQGSGLGNGPDVQLWPHVHGCDAMFLSLLRKVEPSAP